MQKWRGAALLNIKLTSFSSIRELRIKNKKKRNEIKYTIISGKSVPRKEPG
jgi:hypothetical protein